MKKVIIITIGVLILIAGFIVVNTRFNMWYEAHKGSNTYTTATSTPQVNKQETVNDKLQKMMLAEAERRFNTPENQQVLKLQLERTEREFKDRLLLQVNKEINILTVTEY